MATVNDIIELAMDSVADSSFEDRCVGFLNQGIQHIASLVRLPDLLVSDAALIVPANTSQVNLPEDYWDHLYMVHDDSGRRVDVFRDSFFTFLRKFPKGKAGTSIIACAPVGRVLHTYYTCQTDKTLKLFYGRRPTVLEESDDVVEIPEPFASTLLEAYVCMECFRRIEDGVEGRKTNTDHWNRTYLQGIAELISFLGIDDAEPEYVADEDWI